MYKFDAMKIKVNEQFKWHTTHHRKEIREGRQKKRNKKLKRNEEKGWASK